MASVISSFVPSPIFNIGSFSLTSSLTIVAKAEVSSIDETTTGPILRQKKTSWSSLFIILLDIPLLVPTATLVVLGLFSLFSASSSPSNSLLSPKPVSGSSQSDRFPYRKFTDVINLCGSKVACIDRNPALSFDTNHGIVVPGVCNNSNRIESMEMVWGGGRRTRVQYYQSCSPTCLPCAIDDGFWTTRQAFAFVTAKEIHVATERVSCDCCLPLLPTSCMLR